MNKKTQVLKVRLSILTFMLSQAVFCNSSFAQQNSVIPQNTAEFPIVPSAALNTDINVPWSQPVRVRDPFEGEFIAIFDRNYFFQYFLNNYVEVDVISLWRQDSIQMLLALSNRDCMTGMTFYAGYLRSGCNFVNGVETITQLYIKLGERVFKLEGQNSVFRVNEELAAALRNSSAEKIDIRLITASGAAIDSQIGKGTVSAWKKIY